MSSQDERGDRKVVDDGASGGADAGQRAQVSAKEAGKPESGGAEVGRGSINRVDCDGGGCKVGVHRGDRKGDDNGRDRRADCRAGCVTAAGCGRSQIRK